VISVRLRDYRTLYPTPSNQVNMVAISVFCPLMNFNAKDALPKNPQDFVKFSAGQLYYYLHGNDNYISLLRFYELIQANNKKCILLTHKRHRVPPG
jgi:hypothetical protein